jgi:hypothetical protein
MDTAKKMLTLVGGAMINGMSVKNPAAMHLYHTNSQHASV